MQHEAGALFIVTGAHYTAAAIAAAHSVAKTNPWLNIGIFSDQPVTDRVFHFVGRIADGSTRRKHEYVGCSPFQKTLYLDSDIRVTSDLHDLFGLLEKFEMAGAHVRFRERAKRLRQHLIDIPQAFPQINCGVLLYKKCPNVDVLFRLWCDIYKAGNFTRDQIPFREALWQSDIKFYVFGPEYNKRFIPFIGLGGEPTPFILHIKGFNSRSRLLRATINALIWPTLLRARRRARNTHD